MADMMNDVDQLAATIGPRPAGTEEEQQAALYIANKMQSEAGFATVIEDFNSTTNPFLTRIVCFGVSFIATLLSLVFPVMGVPAFLLVLACTILFGLEIVGKPVISKMTKSGVSQNVVAKYAPASAGGKQRRKVILIANYDSGKASKLFQGAIGANLGLIRRICAITLAVTAVLLFIKTVFLPSDTGSASMVFNVLLIICLVIMALPLVEVILDKVAAYSDAANNNAAGIAVLMEVATRIGQGMVSASDMKEHARQDNVVIQGEKAARRANAVPEGAELTYAAETHAGQSSEESLAAAKAAIAAMTGKPIADTVPVSDVSAHLVHGNGFGDDAESAKMQFEVTELRQPYQQEGSFSDFNYEGSLGPAAPGEFSEDRGYERVMVSADAEVGSPNTQPSQVSMPTEDAAEVVQDVMNATVSAGAQVAAAPVQPASFTRETPEALRQGSGMASSIDNTPSWAIAAQEKARAHKPDVSASKVRRSRFADNTAAQLNDQRAQETAAPAWYNAGAQAAPAPVPAGGRDVWGGEEPPADPVLAERLAALRASIDEQTNAVKLGSGAASAGSQQSAPTVSRETTPENADMVEVDVERPTSTPIVVPLDGEILEEQPVVEVESAEEAYTHPVDKQSGMPYLDEDLPIESAPPAGGVTGFFERFARAEQAEQSSRRRRTTAEPEPKAPVVGVSDLDDQDDYFDDDIDQGWQEAALQPKPLEETIDVSGMVETEPVNEEVAVLETELIVPVDPSDAAQGAENANVQEQGIEEVAEVEEVVEKVAPIAGMEDLLMSIPELTPEEKASEDGAPSRQVIVLPEVMTARATKTEGHQQRAPMDAGSNADAASALLANMIPKINSDDDDKAVARNRPSIDVPAITNEISNNTVSTTGSFTTVGNTGAFAPVGDELVADVAEEDRYVDDADDSEYATNFTQTGAFAGVGYVDMPKSRAGRLFGRFRKSKEREEAVEESESFSVWAGVDDGFTAQKAGKERGSWESFREDDDEWNGGAFSKDQLKGILSKGTEKVKGVGSSVASKRSKKQQEPEPEDTYNEPINEETEDVLIREEVVEPDVVTPVASSSATSGRTRRSRRAEVIDPAERINEEIKRINSFRHPDIDTEVWFVALGAELANNSGMEAFLAEHRDEMKGAIVVNIEALGAGDLALLEEEGIYLPVKASSRIKRFVRNATQLSGVSCGSAKLFSRNTATFVAAREGIQAMTIAGMDGNQTAYFASAKDTPAIIDEGLLDERADFVMALLKSI